MSQVAIDNSLEQDASALLESAYTLSKDNPEQALVLAHEILASNDSRVSGQTLLLMGKIYYQSTQLDKALSYFEEALDCFEQQNASSLSLETLLSLGRTQRDLGHFDKAAEDFLKSLYLAQTLHDPNSEVNAMNLLASVYDAQGQTALALKYLKESLVLAEQHQLTEKQATILNNIGGMYHSLGNYPNSLEALTKANQLIQITGSNTRNEAANLMHLGHLYQDLNDFTTALDFYIKAKDLSKIINDRLIETSSLNNLSNLHMQLQNWQLAKEGFEEALLTAQQNGLKQFEIDNLDGLGQVHLALGNCQQAIQNHLQALEIATHIGDSQGEIEALLNLGKDYLFATQTDKALEVLYRALDLSDKNPQANFTAHQCLALTYETLKDFDKALHHYKTFHQLQGNLFNEENKRKTRELSIQFDLERVHRQAEEYRLRTNIERQAREAAEAKVFERTKALEEAQLEIVTRLALAGEYRDDDTGEHTRRVGRNSAILAYMLGWAEEDVQTIYSAARLHDVGKIGIRDAILLKPGKLTQDEMVIMKTHTIKGSGILSGGHSKLLRMAEEIAAYHHERWDGTGYPHGLAGLSIPHSARIVAVADVLDALVHERPYKKAWMIEDALKEIERLSATHFDPLVVEMCLRVFRDNPLFSPLDRQNDWESTRKYLNHLPLKNP